MSVRGTRIPSHLQLPIAGVPPPPTEKEGQRLFPTGNFRFYRPVYRDKTPPCNHACPTGEQIQKYLDHVKHDRYLDGYLTILEDNPMPAVTGRVCYHPCETACNRGQLDEALHEQPERAVFFGGRQDQDLRADSRHPPRREVEHAYDLAIDEVVRPVVALEGRHRLPHAERAEIDRQPERRPARLRHVEHLDDHADAQFEALEVVERRDHVTRETTSRAWPR